MPIEPGKRDVFSVSRLNAEVSAVLTSSFPLLWIEGEISNLARPRSGHLYFTLKDSHAQIRCALFRAKRQRLRMQPADGDQVLLRARVALYEPRGDFQLIVEHLEPAGAGALQQAFEALKQKLQAEGLFDNARKAPLPAYPRRLGVITSPSGAAIRDVLQVLAKRYPALDVLIYPAQVQGSEAPAALVDALKLAISRADCDLLLLTRGGGSAEDLAAFNDELLARTIAACPIPLVSAIGHEIDFTIADFVADLRAPTPSAAAEHITPDTTELLLRLRQLDNRLAKRTHQSLRNVDTSVANLHRRLQLQAPMTRVRQQQQRVDEIELRMSRSLRTHLGGKTEKTATLQMRLQASGPRIRLANASQRFAPLPNRLRSAWQHIYKLTRARLGTQTGRLETVSPLATLTRGYAIVEKSATGEIVRDAAQVRNDEVIDIRVGQGRITAKVMGADSGS